jgi:hypothetical protein
MLEDSGVLLRGSRGQRGDPRPGLYGQFAGILQVEIRQRVSSVCRLMLVVCKETIRHTGRATQGTIGMPRNTERLSLAHRRDLRVASCGITKRLLGWPTP